MVATSVLGESFLIEGAPTGIDPSTRPSLETEVLTSEMHGLIRDLLPAYEEVVVKEGTFDYRRMTLLLVQLKTFRENTILKRVKDFLVDGDPQVRSQGVQLVEDLELDQKVLFDLAKREKNPLVLSRAVRLLSRDKEGKPSTVIRDLAFDPNQDWTVRVPALEFVRSHAVPEDVPRFTRLLEEEGFAKYGVVGLRSLAHDKVRGSEAALVAAQPKLFDFASQSTLPDEERLEAFEAWANHRPKALSPKQASVLESLLRGEGTPDILVKPVVKELERSDPKLLQSYFLEELGREKPSDAAIAYGPRFLEFRVDKLGDALEEIRVNLRKLARTNFLESSGSQFLDLLARMKDPVTPNLARDFLTSNQTGYSAKARAAYHLRDLPPQDRTELAEDIYLARLGEGVPDALPWLLPTQNPKEEALLEKMLRAPMSFHNLEMALIRGQKLATPAQYKKMVNLALAAADQFNFGRLLDLVERQSPGTLASMKAEIEARYLQFESRDRGPAMDALLKHGIIEPLLPLARKMLEPSNPEPSSMGLEIVAASDLPLKEKMGLIRPYLERKDPTTQLPAGIEPVPYERTRMALKPEERVKFDELVREFQDSGGEGYTNAKSCSAVCGLFDQTEKWLNVENLMRPDFRNQPGEWEWAIGSLSALFILKAAPFCPKAKPLLAQILKTNFASEPKATQPKLDTSDQDFLRKQIAQAKAEGADAETIQALREVARHMEQFMGGAKPETPTAIYGKQFYSLLLRELLRGDHLSEAIRPGVEAELARVDASHRSNLRSFARLGRGLGGSLYNTYAVSASALSVGRLDRSVYDKMAGIARQAQANAKAAGDPDVACGLPYLPGEGVYDTPRGSAARAPLFYLALYRSTTDVVEKRRWRGLLRRCMAVTTGSSLVGLKAHSTGRLTHYPQEPLTYSGKKRESDYMAPYYFMPMAPFGVMALETLLADPEISPEEKRGLERQQQVLASKIYHHRKDGLFIPPSGDLYQSAAGYINPLGGLSLLPLCAKSQGKPSTGILDPSLVRTLGPAADPAGAGQSADGHRDSLE